VRCAGNQVSDLDGAETRTLAVSATAADLANRERPRNNSINRVSICMFQIFNLLRAGKHIRTTAKLTREFSKDFAGQR
jgi:hypothetical protein